MENHDLKSRIVALEHNRTEHAARLLGVETWQRQADIHNARRDEQFKHIEIDLGSIKNTLQKIMWLIIGGIGAGIISFILKGGLNI